MREWGLGIKTCQGGRNGKMKEEKEKQRKKVRESREMTTRERKESEVGSGRK